MPFIKYKAFALDSVLCYKCGKEITKGQFNWSYNTRKAGMFSHKDCLLNEEQFKDQINTPETEPELEPVFESTPVSEVESSSDITDKITLTGKHKQTDLIKIVLSMREYPFLFGAPGAGKTHLMLSIAQDMDLDFVNVSCANDMFKSELLGSVSPVSGNYYATAFYHAWEKGGLILLDEVGLASGAFLNVLNAGLAQREIRFPNGKRVQMHPHCFIAFADNSALYGNDPLFPERQDAGTAFRDRISYIEFEYDTDLEFKIISARFNGDTGRAKSWHSTILKLRTEINALNVPVFVSPRFAYAGAKGFVKGLSYERVIKMYLMRGLNGDIHNTCQPVISKYNRAY